MVRCQGLMPDAAFNRAFKRKFDTTPGAARRAARA
jgi:AraC-like DNA-binding protein